MGFRRALLAPCCWRNFFKATRPAMPPTARAERATAQSRIKRTLTMIGKPKSSVSVAQKRAKALFTAETKENMSVPSGSDFALTPKGAWGAALIVEEKKRPKSHAVSKRASPRKQGQWAGADSPAVEQHGRAPRIAAARYPPPSPQKPTWLLRAATALPTCQNAAAPPPASAMQVRLTLQPNRNQVRQFGWDHEHTLLDEWNLAFNGSWPLQLCGKVFNNAGPGLEDGDMVEYTSQVTAA